MLAEDDRPHDPFRRLGDEIDAAFVRMTQMVSNPITPRLECSDPKLKALFDPQRHSVARLFQK